MYKSTAKTCLRGLLLCALLPTALFANSTPPKVTSTSGEPIHMRLMPGYEARCFKETKTRERGNWAAPKTTFADYKTSLEVRNGVEFLTLTTQFQRYETKVLMELNPNGGVRRVPPLIETNIPEFEKEHGSAVTQMVGRMIASTSGGEGFLGRTFEIGKTYGPSFDLCTALGAQIASSPKGSTTLEGTLNYSGRPAFLVTQIQEQTCMDNDVRFSVEASAWALYDRGSGLTMSNVGQINVFSQGSRITQIDERTECGVTSNR